VKELISGERHKQRQEQEPEPEPEQGQEQRRIKTMPERKCDEVAQQEKEAAEAEAQKQATRADAIEKLSALFEQLGSERDYCIDLIELIWPDDKAVVSRLRDNDAEGASDARP
jgi:hypothetical protein